MVFASIGVGNINEEVLLIQKPISIELSDGTQIPIIDSATKQSNEISALTTFAVHKQIEKKAPIISKNQVSEIIQSIPEPDIFLKVWKTIPVKKEKGKKSYLEEGKVKFKTVTENTKLKLKEKITGSYFYKNLQWKVIVHVKPNVLKYWNYQNQLYEIIIDNFNITQEDLLKAYTPTRLESLIETQVMSTIETSSPLPLVPKDIARNSESEIQRLVKNQIDGEVTLAPNLRHRLVNSDPIKLQLYNVENQLKSHTDSFAREIDLNHWVTSEVEKIISKKR